MPSTHSYDPAACATGGSCGEAPDHPIHWNENTPDATRFSRLAQMAREQQQRRTHTFELLLSAQHDYIQNLVEGGESWEESLENLVGFQDIEPMTLREWDARIQELKDWRANGGLL